MKRRSLALLILCIAISISRGRAQQYAFDKKIALPGDGGYDYMAIDEVNHHLFVSHGTSFNVIDLATEQPIGSIDGLKGVHGIAFSNELGRGFISDGKDNSVVVVDLKTLKIIKTIPLNTKGPDAIIYDPFSKKILAFNGGSDNAAVVDPETMTQTATIALGGGPEFAVSDGKGLVYNNLEDLNAIKVIDTKNMTVRATYPLSPCGGPTGLALDLANGRLFTGCRTNKGLSVVDASTGKVISTLPIGAGVDAVIYDPTRRLIFVSNGDATTTIISQGSADDYAVIQTLTTMPRAKTMALDRTTGRIYLSAPEFEPGTRKIIPGTFAVLVYKPQ